VKAVILVGGEGTRLRPLTLDTPKPLMPVGNRPFLAHVLAHLSRHGITEAILTTGYLASRFQDLRPEDTFGVRLTVVAEDGPLDTAGAVKNVERLLEDTFLVLNGDILTDLDLTALVAYHRERGSLGTIALTAVEDPQAYGLVLTGPEGRIERFLEKPRADEVVTNLVNAGTYVLEPDLLKRIPAGPYSFERELFPDLLADMTPMYAFRSPAYWLDLGTPATYLRANGDVVERLVGEEPPGRRTPSGAWVGEGTRVDPSVRVRGAAIGPGCRIELGAAVHPRTCLGAACTLGEGAVVERSVLHDEVVVGAGAVVRDAVLGRGARVGEGARVVDAVVGPGVRVGADNELRGGIRVWPGVEIPDGAIRF
jgi:mannose-1-phosphate guanylyltransferase